MPTCSRGEVVLVRYPFSDLSSVKVRPAIVVHAPYPSEDCFLVPLTSRIEGLLPGEFVLNEWREAGLHVPFAVKRGLHTAHETLVVKTVGRLVPADMARVTESLRGWLGL
jgi:mRNA interferase MazF